MSESPLRDKLLELLRQDGLDLQLVAAAARLVAADAAFNLAVARHKERRSDIDFVELVMFEGEVMDRCERELATFARDRMMELSQQLEAGCADLVERTRVLNDLL